jgi:hypothetical protein
MSALAYKSLSSRLAKTTFIALVPKLLPEEASALASAFKETLVKEILGDSDFENRARELLQELLDTLPAEAKKD